MILSNTLAQSEKNGNIRCVDKIKIHEYILAVYTLQEKLKITGSEKKTGKIKKKTLCLWAKRDLSIKGKIIILKTLTLSKINYIISSIGLLEEVLIQRNRILFRFLWKQNSRIRGRLKKLK